VSPDPRKSERRRADEVPHITGLRFLPDRAPAELVNMSPIGLLAESSTRLRVGSDVTVLFEGGFEPSSMAGRVARCEVAAMAPDGTLRYRIAIEFDATVRLSGASEPLPASPDDAAPVARNRW
jgi:hypothetical protein